MLPGRIIAALFDALSGGSQLSTDVIVGSIGETIPLSKTMSEQLDQMRNWAQGRARPASKSEATQDEFQSRRKIEF